MFRLGMVQQNTRELINGIPGTKHLGEVTTSIGTISTSYKRGSAHIHNTPALNAFLETSYLELVPCYSGTVISLSARLY